MKKVFLTLVVSALFCLGGMAYAEDFTAFGDESTCVSDQQSVGLI